MNINKTIISCLIFVGFVTIATNDCLAMHRIASYFCCWPHRAHAEKGIWADDDIYSYTAEPEEQQDSTHPTDFAPAQQEAAQDSLDTADQPVAQPEQNQGNKLVRALNSNQASSDVILSVLAAHQKGKMLNIHLTCRALRYANASSSKILRIKPTIRPTNCQSPEGFHAELDRLISLIKGNSHRKISLDLSHLAYFFNQKVMPAAQVISAICECSNVQELNLRSNLLKQLPESLKQLPQLKKLYLADNMLDSNAIIPVCECTQLEKLNLSGNYITRLPEQIKQLAQLRVIDIGNNDLSRAEFKQLHEWLPSCRDEYIYDPYETQKATVCIEYCDDGVATEVMGIEDAYVATEGICIEDDGVATEGMGIDEDHSDADDGNVLELA